MDEGNDSKVTVYPVKKRKSLNFKLPKSFKKLRNHKKILLILLVIICILGIGGVLFIQQKNEKDITKQCNGKDDSPIYTEAANVMNPSANSNLLKTVLKMKSMKNVDSDPTCLYVMTFYFDRASDAENLRKYYDKLVKVANKDTKYAKPIQSSPELIKTLEYLKFRVEQLEKVKNNISF